MTEMKNLGEALAASGKLTSNDKILVEIGGSIRRMPAKDIAQAFGDMAVLGAAYGTCTTDAATTAKTVSISDFILLKNAIVSILFTKANAAKAATLNVSSTGAKPIRANGQALQPGLIKSQTVVQFQYDGTAWNIVGMFGLEQTATPTGLFVDLGLPSGLLWAKANIDITTESGFQEVDGQVSPYKYACSFCSWGNTDMHNPVGTSFSGSYNWGGVNEAEPWYDGQVYGSTPGAALTASFGPSYDAARANLGAPWRMPTTAEFAELFANIEYITPDGELVSETTSVAKTAADKRVNVNGIVGLLLRSKINGNTLFFPASGYGYGATWYYRGAGGYYWSASFYSARDARYLYFGTSGVYPQNTNYRYYGLSVRPVQ